MSTIFSIAIGIFSFGIGTAVATAMQLTGMAAAAVAGAVAGFVGGFFHGIVNGLSPGDALLGAFKGAAFGALSAVAAMGVADYISGAFPGIDGHAISLWVARSARGYTAAITKAIMQGVVRGAITLAQGGKFLANFASGFVSSAFTVGRRTFGEGAVAARTAVMALIGGVTSELTGGKFGNGALSGAFVHLFNNEADHILSRQRRDIADDLEVRAVQKAGSYQEIINARKKIDALFTNGADIVMVVSGAGDVFYLVRGAALGIKSTYFYTKSATGGLKQWFRYGDSFSKTYNIRTYAIRWGTNNFHGKKIGSSYLRNINRSLREIRMPLNTWNSQDAGHFHLRFRWK